MAINNSLLIAAPMLQDYIVDKDTGECLAGGKIYLYQDSSRTTFKNWYYQTGIPGSYQYITLPNPLTLSSAGTIQDPNGNDVIPFFYPYSETNENVVQTYHIKVYGVDSEGNIAELQFTRDFFPYTPSNSPTSNITPTLRNYIVNNRFWRNVVPGSTVDVSGETDYVLAPSQHNGFSMPNIRFKKNVVGNNDQISFTEFTSNDPLNNDVASEYYMRIQCLGAGTVETYKYIQIPVSLHLKTLSSVDNITIVFQAINNTSDPDNTISVSLFPFTGTGSVSPAATLYDTKTTTSSWHKYTVGPITSPSAFSSATGAEDDALYLQLGFPLNKTYDISIALPSLYLSKEIPDNDFDTYEDIDSIINTPMTGDIRQSIQSAYILGWVAMNDGTIGNRTSLTSSNATTRANADTWQLFNLLWSATTNNQCQMFTSAGVPVVRGSDAITDFNNFRTIAIPKALGRVIAGANPSSLGIQKFITASSSGGLLLTISTDNGDTSPFYTGTQVTFTNTGGALPTGLVAATQYYLTVINSTTMKVSTSLANALANPPVYIAFTDAGTGTNSFTTTVPAHVIASYTGEDIHALGISEMPAHNHAGSTSYPLGPTGATAAKIGFGQDPSTPIPLTIASQGGSTAHNTLQPTTYMNIFMKL